MLGHAAAEGAFVLEVTLNIKALALGVAIAGASVCGARAALNESQFPPQTVRDLVAICAPAQDDPMMTPAINYCHGYAEGSVIVEMAHEARNRSPALFCLPKPAPASGGELTSFIAWANQDPTRLDKPAVDGMFLYLAQKYPCGKRR